MLVHFDPIYRSSSKVKVVGESSRLRDENVHAVNRLKSESETLKLEKPSYGTVRLCEKVQTVTSLQLHSVSITRLRGCDGPITTL